MNFLVRHHGRIDKKYTLTLLLETTSTRNSLSAAVNIGHSSFPRFTMTHSETFYGVGKYWSQRTHRKGHRISFSCFLTTVYAKTAAIPSILFIPWSVKTFQNRPWKCFVKMKEPELKFPAKLSDWQNWKFMNV